MRKLCQPLILNMLALFATFKTLKVDVHNAVLDFTNQVLHVLLVRQTARHSTQILEIVIPAIRDIR